MQHKLQISDLNVDDPDPNPNPSEIAQPAHFLNCGDSQVARKSDTNNGSSKYLRYILGVGGTDRPTDRRTDALGILPRNAWREAI